MQAKNSDLTLRALTAWLEVFRARQTLAVSEMNVLSRKQILTFIEEREKLGGSPQSDVLRVRVEVDAQSDMTWVVLSDPVPAGDVGADVIENCRHRFGRDAHLRQPGRNSAPEVMR